MKQTGDCHGKPEYGSAVHGCAVMMGLAAIGAAIGIGILGGNSWKAQRVNLI